MGKKEHFGSGVLAWVEWNYVGISEGTKEELAIIRLEMVGHGKLWIMLCQQLTIAALFKSSPKQVITHESDHEVFSNWTSRRNTCTAYPWLAGDISWWLIQLKSRNSICLKETTFLLKYFFCSCMARFWLPCKQAYRVREEVWHPYTMFAWPACKRWPGLQHFVFSGWSPGVYYKLR